MRLSSALLLYRVRLRTRLVQELFAILGITVGVALLFASQVASTSLNGSVKQMTEGIVGNMRYQLTARGPEGFDQRMLGEVQSLPGVRAAEPVLDVHANVIGPNGQRAVDLIGTDPRFARLGGPLLRHFTAAQLIRQQAFALPAPIAQSLGLLSLQPVTMQIGAREVNGFLGAELLASDIGELINSPAAIAPLAYAQRLAGMPARVTSIFVQSTPGHDRQVHEGLVRLAADRLNVEPATFDATLFALAARPANQSALLFAAISALVGFLFAFNAILLTIPQRRRLVEDLRMDGYSRRAILEVLLLDALILGTVASLLGLLIGDVLSLAVFDTNPSYLSYAFPIGSQRIVTWRCVAIAAGGGMLAACFGVLAPLRADIFSRLSLAPLPGLLRDRQAQARLSAAWIFLALTTVILFAAPQAAIVGIVSLVFSLLLFLPALVGGFVTLFDRLQRNVRGVAPYLAVIELRSQANRPRALAIAATGAIAVFGSVAIEGARGNLQGGLDASARDIDSLAEIWVSPSGTSNTFATVPFNDLDSGVLRRLPGIGTVRLYRGSFLDYGARRVWVLAPPRAALRPIPSSQLLSGGLTEATARFRGAGWAILSQGVADEHHLRIGQRFTLPSPRPATFRLAALSTNLGWPPGAVMLNAEDYARAWGSEDPSAYQITLAPGVSLAKGRREIEQALGPRSGLAVETFHQREQRHYATTRQSLSRLTEIRTMVLIAAVLAMSAAMGAMIWQRRRRLADMKVDGFGRGVLWRGLLCESAVLLAAGCSIGGAFGIYGQLLLSHALARVTGFPVVFSVGILVALASLVLVTTVAVVIIALPGYIAVRVRPALSLQD
jgi:putative ABC transport system permease protein